MPERDFLDFLSKDFEDRIRCVFETRAGRVTDIHVVQYETLTDHDWIPVVRYDTAHGFFHRDVYFAGGKKHFKERVVTLSLEDALTFAIEDIRHNWYSYKLAFMERTNA
jgi:hypothetical protein